MHSRVERVKGAKFGLDIESLLDFARDVVGNPHVGAKNVERLLGEGYRFLMSAPSRSYGVVGQGRELAGY